MKPSTFVCTGFWLALMAFLLAPAVIQATQFDNSAKLNPNSLNIPLNIYYQPATSTKHNTQKTEKNNLNPAFWTDDDDAFTVEESEGNSNQGNQIKGSEAVTTKEPLAYLSSEDSQIRNIQTYLITTCLRI